MHFDIDHSGFRRHASAWLKIAPDILADHFAKLPPKIAANIRRHLSKRTIPEGAWSRSSKLGSRTGALDKALERGAPGNTTVIQKNAHGATLRYALDVPQAIHETGGFIASKGRMHRYFWARFMQTKNDFFRRMALSVKRRGGIRLPRRPWWTPGTDEFLQSADRVVVAPLRAAFAAAWNKSRGL